MADLLPCPFVCGAERSPVINSDGFGGFVVSCPHCYASTHEHGDRGSAIRAWNTRAQSAELAAARAEVERLRAFAQDVMEHWPEGAPDGGDLQEYAVKYGLLRGVEMPGPCGENCGCTEYLANDEWPSTCYRRTSLLTGERASDERIAAHAEALREVEAKAVLWDKHSGSFAVLEAMLNAASPLVLNKLKAADAVIDAAMQGDAA